MSVREDEKIFLRKKGKEESPERFFRFGLGAADSFPGNEAGRDLSRYFLRAKAEAGRS